MRSFDKIEKEAAKRKGGAKALDAMLTPPLPPQKIRKKPDDRWLSEMSKCVFQAGFSWRLIEDKWPAFEKEFHKFDVARAAMMSPDEFDRLMKAEGIVKNAAKIRSVSENAIYLRAIAKEHGSVGAYFAGWKTADYCDNLRALQKSGARLGGRAAQIFLRRMGVDTLVFSPDVLAALKREGVVAKSPGGKKEWAALQEAIDDWSAASGRSLNEISQILAFSVESA